MVKHIKRFMLKGTLSSNLGPKYGLLISACVYIYICIVHIYIERALGNECHQFPLFQNYHCSITR